MKSKTQGLLFIFLSALLFGSFGIWSKLIGDSKGIFYPNWTRALAIAIVIFPIVLLAKQIKPINRKDWKWLSLYLICTAGTQAPLFYAFNHMDIGTATLLFFVTMILTMYIIGFTFLGEKITSIKIISFVIAGIGLYITFSFSITIFALFAALMAIVNGLASGTEVSISKKLSDNYTPLYLTWMSWLMIAITNGIISLFLGETQYLPTFDTYWFYQVLYGITAVFGFWLVIKGFKYVEASIGGLIGLLEIIFSITFGAIIFHQNISLNVTLGAIIILCAVALPHLYNCLKLKR